MKIILKRKTSQPDKAQKATGVGVESAFSQDTKDYNDPISRMNNSLFRHFERYNPEFLTQE